MFQQEPLIIGSIKNECDKYIFSLLSYKFLGYDALYIYEDPIVAKIENYRRVHGLTYKKLARLAGIGNAVIREIVRGKHENFPKGLQKVFKVISTEASI